MTPPTRTGARKPLLGDERGSAVVEFVFLGVLLLVPVVYLVLTVGQLQGGSFAVVGASDQAAKVYVDSPTPQEADARAREAARIALADFGFTEDQAVVNIACSGQCLAPASHVTVVVTLKVPLPLIPAVSGSYPSAATVDSSSTQIVERFG
jgi:Flp pilus assembly protein TadG